MRLFRARNLTAALGVLGAAGVLATSTSVFAGSAPPTDKDTVGVYVSATRTFFLRNVNTEGNAALRPRFGPTGTITPLVGDYDNNGSDTIGVFRAAGNEFFLRNANTDGLANISFVYGRAANADDDNAIVGDWDGANGDSVGLYDPIKGRFLLRNTNNGGVADISSKFGRRNQTYVALRGNWSGGDSIDGIGLYDPATATFFLRDNPSGNGPADFSFTFGPTGQNLIPVVGNWNDDDTDTVGLYDPATQRFWIKNTLDDGPADSILSFGPSGALPVAGNYDAN